MPCSSMMEGISMLPRAMTEQDCSWCASTGVRMYNNLRSTSIARTTPSPKQFDAGLCSTGASSCATVLEPDDGDPDSLVGPVCASFVSAGLEVIAPFTLRTRARQHKETSRKSGVPSGIAGRLVTATQYTLSMMGDQNAPSVFSRVSR